MHRVSRSQNVAPTKEIFRPRLLEIRFCFDFDDPGVGHGMCAGRVNW